MLDNMIFNSKSLMIPEGSVVKITDPNGVVLWKKESVVIKDYFYIEPVDVPTTISFNSMNTAPQLNLEYSTDGNNWQPFTLTDTTTLDCPTKTYFRGDNPYIGVYNTAEHYWTIDGTEKFNAGGDIMSLLSKTIEPKDMSATDCSFSRMFNNSTKLYSLEEMRCTASKLGRSMFNHFAEGSSVVYAPKQVFEYDKLTYGCFQYMFNNCQSLLTPMGGIVAQTNEDYFADHIYNQCTLLQSTGRIELKWISSYGLRNAFFNCSNLSDATQFSVNGTIYQYGLEYAFYNTKGIKKIGDSVLETPNNSHGYICRYMFLNSGIQYASNISIKCVQSNYRGTYGFGNMFQGCVSLTTPPVISGLYIYNYCFYYMFYGCTALTTAPALPATTLATYCYYSMFNGCTALTTAPVLPATTLAQSCYYRMFYGCTALTTAPALPATTLADSCYNSMFYGCTALTTAPALPATDLNYQCYYQMFYMCTSLTTAPALPATDLKDWCYAYMFYGCTALTTAPALPATTLAERCYSGMFRDCTNLKEITTYAEDISAIDCLTNWMANVSPVGDFYNEGGANYEIDSASGIPSGWVEHKVEPVDYSKYPFFIENAGGDFNNVTLLKNNDNAYTANLQIGVPLGDKDDLSSIWWLDAFDTSTSGRSYSLAYNQRIYFRATGNVGYLNSANNNYNYFTSDDKVNVGGNIMSLGYNEFEDKVSITQQYAYEYVFRNMSNLVDASKLVLPATTLATYCYQYMFYYCSSLTTAPSILPATTLASSCYRSMFAYCTSLTEAPVLPATTLGTYCYHAMFQNCISLTTAPELPATTLKSSCYQYMFIDCSKLNYIKAMFITASSTSYTTSWVQGVASTGTFVKNVNATWNVTGINGVPSGWTIETASN